MTLLFDEMLDVGCLTCTLTQDYNFREYAKRRVVAGFRENATAKNDEALKLMTKAEEELARMNRMSTLLSLYHQGPSVMELARSAQARA